MERHYHTHAIFESRALEKTVLSVCVCNVRPLNFLVIVD